MSPRKPSREQNDKNKKRKRDVADPDPNSKRQRGQRLKNGEAEAKGSETSVLQNGNTELTPGAVQKVNTIEGGWRLSTPMGGRMLDIDPILTEDNQ